MLCNIHFIKKLQMSWALTTTLTLNLIKKNTVIRSKPKLGPEQWTGTGEPEQIATKIHLVKLA
jgi:hypothetical protein